MILFESYVRAVSRCRLAGVFVLLLCVGAVRAAADDPGKVLEKVCSPEFMQSYRSAVKQSDLDALASKGPTAASCANVWLGVRSQHRPVPQGDAGTADPPSAAGLPPAGAGGSGDAIAQAEAKLKEVHCADLNKTLNARQLDRIAAGARNPDCAILVALEYRRRGDSGNADRVAREVDRLYSDPTKPTYPLILFYKAAYLGETGVLGELERIGRSQGAGGRQPAGRESGARALTPLAQQAVDLLLQGRQTEITGFLADPSRPCPNLDNVPGVEGVRQALVRVCDAYRGWSDAIAQRQASREVPVAAELTQRLGALAEAYPVRAFETEYRAPAWMEAARRELRCVDTFDVSYQRARDAQASLSERQAALNEAVRAAEACPISTLQIAFPVEDLSARLSRVTADLRSAKGAEDERDRLEDRMARIIAAEGIAARTRVWEWQADLRRIGNLEFTPGMQSVLRIFDEYDDCLRRSTIGPKESLPKRCRDFGAVVDDRRDGGARSVSYPGTKAADAAVRAAVAPARAASKGSGKVVESPADAVDQSLLKVFTYLMSDAVLKQRGIVGDRASFEKVVRAQLLQSSARGDCISSDSWGSLQTNRPWLLIAFADCSLAQGKWEDALKNLDKAAREIGARGYPDLRELIPRRLVVLQAEAESAGATSFGKNDILRRVGSKDSSAWLKGDLRRAFFSGSTEMSGGTSRFDTDAQKPPIQAESSQAREGCMRSRPTTGRGAGATMGKCGASAAGSGLSPNRYANDWARLEALDYYKTLSGSGAPNWGSPMKKILVDAEHSDPGLLAVFAWWDGLLLNELPSDVGDREKFVASRLFNATADQLSALSVDLDSPRENAKLGGQASGGSSSAIPEFMFRHAIARRALELRCKEFALSQLGMIKPDSSIGPEYGAFHTFVVMIAQGLTDSGACRTH